jgi:hypothetical protein
VKEMSDQVRGILFVVVSLLILFAWGHFYKPPVPPPQTNAAQSSAPVSQQGAQQASVQSGAAGNATSAGAAAKSGATAGNPAAVEASAEQTTVVQSALYRVELSNRGGVVKTWQLIKYFDDQKPPRPLDLVNDSVARELGAGGCATGGESEFGVVSSASGRRAGRGGRKDWRCFQCCDDACRVCERRGDAASSDQNYFSLERWTSGRHQDAELQ